MKPRSFRLRLALISATIAAIGLFVFGLAVSSLWKNDRVKRLDEELSRRGHVLASRGFSKAGWETVYESMETMLGEEKSSARFLVVRTGKDGTPLYQSKSWPSGLDLTNYPASTEMFEWGGSERDFFRPPSPRRREQEGNQPDTMENQRTPSRDPFPRRENRPIIRKLKKAQFYDAKIDDQHWRIGVYGNQRIEILLGASLDDLHSELRSLWFTFGIAALGSLSLIALGSWLLARKALTPINALTDATKQVSAGDLSTRLSLPNADQEFLPLINVYNTMMARLERSFHQATRFSADASHELKTPVAIMKGTLERALADSLDGSREQAIYTSLLEETDHQQAILQTLLLLSRADAGKLQITSDRVCFSGLVTDTLDDAEMMAEDREITLTSKITPNLEVLGDANLLQQVLHNLLTNAVKYNRHHGTLNLSLRTETDQVILEITNTGPAISQDAQKRLFERFFRAEAARSNREEGIGLGLSLSLELVKAHQGTLTLTKSIPDETTFELRLPLCPREASLA